MVVRGHLLHSHCVNEKTDTEKFAYFLKDSYRILPCIMLPYFAMYNAHPRSSTMHV